MRQFPNRSDRDGHESENHVSALYGLRRAHGNAGAWRQGGRARSVTMSPNVPGGSKADPNIDAIATELEAMQIIAKVLAGIRDPQTRERVVQWTYDRFMKAAPDPAPPVRPDVPKANPDLVVEYALDPDDASALSVDTLYDLFDGPPTSPATAPARLTDGTQSTTVEPL